MIQNLKHKIIVVCGCVVLAACGGERRVEGEMPFDSGSLMTMAESFLKAGDYSNAMRLFQRAATESPTHVPSRLGLAQTYQALGATDAALNFYDQVLVLEPGHKEAQLGIGQMLIARNRPGDAIPYLTDLAKTDPENHKIFNMLGLAHDLLGQQEEAQMQYGRGLVLKPDHISLLNNLALSFAFEGQYAPAIKLLSKAINLDYTVTKAQQNLVLVYVLSGEEAAGRQIGAGLMTAEEMENNIRHYNWVKSLPAGQRAQAIYLGVKNFPEEKLKIGEASADSSSPMAEQVAGEVQKEVPRDPKKAQLQALLAEERQIKKQDTNQKKGQIEPSSDPKPLIKSEVRLEPAPATAEETDYQRPSRVYRVQLGAYPNADLAQAGWAALKRRSEGVLESYQPLVKLVSLANGKTLFRLFVAGIEDKTVAETTCATLRDQSVDCLVLHTSRD